MPSVANSSQEIILRQANAFPEPIDVFIVARSFLQCEQCGASIAYDVPPVQAEADRLYLARNSRGGDKKHRFARLILRIRGLAHLATCISPGHGL